MQLRHQFGLFMDSISRNYALRLAAVAILFTGAAAAVGQVPNTLRHTIANPSPGVDDAFGIAVAVSGTRMVVGARLDDTGAIDAGTAYVYDLTSQTPTVPIVTLNNPTPATGDNFGISVRISGNLVVVGAEGDDTGASNAGSAYVYDLGSQTPTVPTVTLNNPAPRVDARFGFSVAISGTRVIVGAGGSAYVYELTSASPAVPIRAFNAPDTACSFGYSVAISGDYALVGAPCSSTAYVYSVSIGTYFRLVLPDRQGGESFGTSVAMSGSRAVVGAPRRNTGGSSSAGSAFVYDIESYVGSDPEWPKAVLNNPAPAESDEFGTSVSISGTRVIVGAWRDDAGATDTGSAYVYDVSSSSPTTPLATINNPAPAAGDGFGFVAIDGVRVVVGAPRDDTPATDTGAAYVFAPPRVTPALYAIASSSVPIGQTIADGAILSNGSAPTGTMTFNLYGPNNATCSGAPIFTSAVAVNGNGNYFSEHFRPTTTGTYRWIASYSGDAENAPVSNACNDPNQSVVVTAAATSTVIASSSNPSAVGQSVTFTATVTSRGGTPSGSVQFRIDGVNVGAPVALNGNGTATYTTSSLAAGNHTVAADYTGSADFNASSGSLSGGQQVNAVATPTPTVAPTPTATPAPTATATPTPEPSATPTPSTSPTPRQLLNIATRLRVQTGENVLIGGLIVTGNDKKKVIIRAIGPSLSHVFDGALQDTVLELYQGETLLAANDNWKQSQQQEIEETGVPPNDEGESAIVYTLDPGFYTAVMSGRGGATGIGVIEVYDLDQAANSTLANIASRGFVEAGDDVMIGGLIVGGNGTQDARILLRAIGPSLANAGISDALSDPTLELRGANGDLVRDNDNWADTQPSDIEATTIPPSHPAESAIIATLAPGNYTAIVRGKNNTRGVGVVEVYSLQ